MKKNNVFVGKYKRVSKGAKRLAPINMRKEEHQFVIDGFLLDEVLNHIPSGITIVGAQVYMVKSEKSCKLVVPTALRKYGVSHMWKMGAYQRTSIICDQISKSALKEKVAYVCKSLGLDYQKAYFKYITLSNGKGTVKFQYTTKEITPDETDLRKKLKVLGATIGINQVQSVISDINANKYKCVIKEEPVKLVMCYKE